MDFKAGIQRGKARWILVGIILLAILGGFFDYPKAWDKVMDKFRAPDFPSRPYQLGLDIAGGTSLTYRADLSNVKPEEHSEAMEGLRDVVERRVNLFGVREPRVEVAKTPEEWRLIVELAGIKDINEAIRLIGETPFLEFREVIGTSTPEFLPTGLTGKFLERAEVDFQQTTGQPIVLLQFNQEGAKLFGEITSRNVGKPVAIFLDGGPISVPTVENAITDGRAQITGQFTFDEAKLLARRLNEGALPVPITLISQRSVGAILGEEALQNSVRAGAIGFLLVSLFMILYYRLSGVIAVAALLVYTAFVLAIFKLIPVTLTLAGIAGFVLSVGMAVDANILIFERTKEELRKGKALVASLADGFSRAWPSIRDSNITTIITSIVLYTFATSIIKGFALTLLIGVLVSMFSAIFVTRQFLRAFVPSSERAARWWFGVKPVTSEQGTVISKE